jgi:hypothetical protein
MATITGYRCVDQANREVPCFAFGNNVAFNCTKCGHPMLAIVRLHQRGSSSTKPMPCPCGSSMWVTLDATIENRLKLHRAS